MAQSPTITKPTQIVQHPDQKEASLSQQSVSPTLISEEQVSVESQKKNEEGGGTKNASGGDEKVEKGEKVKEVQEGEGGDLISAGTSVAGDKSLEGGKELKKAEKQKSNDKLSKL